MDDHGASQDTRATTPIPGAAWSWATLVTGVSSLAGSLVHLVGSWNADDYGISGTGLDDRIVAFGSTLGSATLLLFVAAMFADDGRSRRWAFWGAAAYALSFVASAVFDQHVFTSLREGF